MGVYYYRARVFSPTLGRFVTSDPIGFRAGDTNLYRYVGNSPGGNTDPSGLLAAVGYSAQSSKKDPAIAKGAQCTGRAISRQFLEVVIILAGLAIGEQPPQGAPGGVPQPGAPAGQPLDPGRPPKLPRPPGGGKRPRGLRPPPGNCSPFAL